MASNKFFFWSNAQELDIVPWDSIRKASTIYLKGSNEIRFVGQCGDDIVKLVYATYDDAKQNLLRLFDEAVTFSTNDELQKQVDQLTKALQILWIAPGMPGFDEVSESFKEKVIRMSST